jgi:acyl-CoA dehydrogenase
MTLRQLAIERIGEECNSLRTFFSAHTSIGQMVLQGWANEGQKSEYLPKTCDGRSIMAFALTEPAAGRQSLSTKWKKTLDWETPSRSHIVTSLILGSKFVISL